MATSELNVIEKRIVCLMDEMESLCKTLKAETGNSPIQNASNANFNQSIYVKCFQVGAQITVLKGILS